MMRSREDAGSSRPSLWMATADMPEYPPLTASTSTDVCIVGAGIAGMTTAHLLAKAGRKVVVLDDGPVGGGMTGHTTAHLASAIDNRFVEIERMHGPEGARLAAGSHSAAIDRIEEIVGEERIACDFERLDGYLFPAPDADGELLAAELAAARRAGLAGVVEVDRAPLPGFDTGRCLRFPDQAQFHPLRYLAGLARAVERNGGRILTGTHVETVNGGMVAEVKAGRHTVLADAVVVATNSPINDLVVIHTKQAPYLTYAIGARIPRGAVPRGLYWDTGDPYHYVRVQRMERGDDILVIGGEDHKTGQAEDTAERHGRLESWGRERFPMMEEVEFAWAGQVMEPVDGLAYIGRNPMDQDNVFIVTGDSGQGLTHGTIAGMLLTDLITGRENPWAGLYDPSRRTLRAAGRYLKETLNMAAQYADWVTAGDVDSEEEVARNSGAVLRRGVAKIAVYRDGSGMLHRRSAVCPHLGCIVAWNAAEETWDCPCHGSRFDRFGTVISGPANADLVRVEEG